MLKELVRVDVEVYIVACDSKCAAIRSPLALELFFVNGPLIRPFCFIYLFVIKIIICNKSVIILRGFRHCLFFGFIFYKVFERLLSKA